MRVASRTSRFFCGCWMRSWRKVRGRKKSGGDEMGSRKKGGPALTQPPPSSNTWDALTGTHPSPILAHLAKLTVSRQTALAPGNEDRVGFWLTPPDLMAELNREFGFNYDACPFPRPAGFDGLREPWGKRTWVNPPFVGPGSSRSAWAAKAIEEQAKGNSSVLILPMDRWVTKLIQAGAELRIPRPFKWLDPKGREQQSGRPAILFILEGKP